MNNVTVSGLKKTLTPGTVITADSDAARGMQVHDMVQDLYGTRMNPGRGADYPDTNHEIKSRKKGTNAAMSIGTMSIPEIIATPFKSSPIYNKLNTISEVTIQDTDRATVIGETELVKVYEMIDQLERDYETARRIFASGDTRPANTKEAPFGYFEEIYRRTGNPNQRKFRIRSNGWNKIKTASRTADTRSKFFD
jgi:hypothetical protein